MNAGQRKAHKTIWIILVIVLPIVMYLSVSHRSNIALESETSKKDRTLATGDDYIHENELIRVIASNGQLHLQLLQPVKSAATLIYALDKDGNSEQLLGQLSDSRNYVFSISEDIAGIKLFDPLKKTEITKLLF